MSGSFIHEYETWFLRKHGYLPEHTIDEVASLQQRVAELEIQTLRYLDTEGCTCCQDREPHEEALLAIGKIFGWPEFDDGSGTDWYKRRDELEINP